MEVAAWLSGLGLGQYEQSFRENDIDAEVLMDLTAEDLIALGVASIGHRRKLLAAVAALRAGSISATTSATAAAHDLLTPLYSQFTEGFGTPDLQAASAILRETIAS